MALTQLSYNVALGWSLQNPNPESLGGTLGLINFGPTSNGLSLTPAVATFNTIYTNVITNLATSAYSADLNMFSFTDYVGNVTGFGHVCGILLLPTGSDMELTVGSTAPLQWFLDGTTQGTNFIKCVAGSWFGYAVPAAGPGYVVDNTHKMLSIRNVGVSGTNSTTIIVYGSST